MNAVAGAMVVEAMDAAQKGQRACAVALAGKERGGIDDVGRNAMLADDPAQLHPGEQVAPGRIDPDRDLAAAPAQGLGKPIGCASVDPSVEIYGRGIPKRAGSRSRPDLD